MNEKKPDLSEEFFDRLAIDIVTGKNKDKIAQMLNDRNVTDVYEKVLWFEQGMLCCRKLVGIDKEWYEKAIAKYKGTAQTNDFLMKEFKNKLTKELIEASALAILTIGCFAFMHYAKTHMLHLIIVPVLPLIGLFTGVAALIKLVWAIKHWRGSLKS